jgi:hypothetical protein
MIEVDMFKTTGLSAAIGLLLALSLYEPARAQQKSIVLVADTVIDGSGQVLHHTSIVVEGSSIKSIGGAIPAGATIYNGSGGTGTSWVAMGNIAP